METRKIAVLGAGIMGHGIAQVLSTAGYEVFLRDVDQTCLENGMRNIKTSLEKFEKKGALSAEEVKRTLMRIHPTVDLPKAVERVDYVIEAAPEVLDLKRKLFSELDRLVSDHAVLATNTSQFSITSIASATTRPDRVIGTHFFNPPVIRRLVEIIRALGTSDEALRITQDLCTQCNMETILCRKDTPGFVTSRLTAIFSVEAERIYEEGIASIEDIDKACRLAFGHPMGPFETSDFVGLDTGLRVRFALAQAYGERFRPQQTRINLVEAGHHGRKTGRGFYPYGG
jgi:3-hydroxybutyryl-CoA dehydrogenase